MGTRTIHNFPHSVNMAAALLVLENQRNRHQRVFQPRLEGLDDLRDFEVKNRYRLPRNIIVELHNLIEAEISAETDRSNPVPTMTKVFYCFSSTLIQKYVDKDLSLIW